MTLNVYEDWYMTQLNNIIENGQRRGDRTDTGVISLPFLNYSHDLRRSYPLMSSRKFIPQHPITEMIWMLSGSGNIEYLLKNNCPFWTDFAVKDDIIKQELLDITRRIGYLAEARGVPYGQALMLMGTQTPTEITEELDRLEIPNVVDVIAAKKGDLGPVYGVQWRYWPNPDGTTTDQITYALDSLRENPNNRRLVVDCWNPSFIPNPKNKPCDNPPEGKMSLVPCHFAFGFYTWEIPFHERAEQLMKVISDFDKLGLYPITSVFAHRVKYHMMFDKYNIPKHYLDINFVMRSNDWVLGQPANMNMYSALAMMFAQQLNMTPRFVNFTGWDCHVYVNHLPGVEILNERWRSGEYKHAVPKVSLVNKPDSLFGYHHTDFLVENYNPGKSIKFPIAI